MKFGVSTKENIMLSLQIWQWLYPSKKHGIKFDLLDLPNWEPSSNSIPVQHS